jgi:flagellar biosynthesis protein FlhB
MSDESAERTEEPTGRRLSKAIEEGDVARSMELPAAAVMIAGAVTMALMGSWWVSRFAQQMRAGFTFDRKTLDTPTLLPTTFLYAVGEGLLVVLPLMVVTAVVAIAARMSKPTELLRTVRCVRLPHARECGGLAASPRRSAGYRHGRVHWRWSA